MTTRVAAHEAGHAVAHFVLGREIVRTVARPNEHYTLPLEHTALALPLEAVLFASGWEAEIRLLGSPPEESAEYLKAWIGGGHVSDEEAIEALVRRCPKVDPAAAKQHARALMERYWVLVMDVAADLDKGTDLGQEDLAVLAGRRGVAFGEAVSS